MSYNSQFLKNKQNTRLTQEILPFKVKHYQHQDELHMLLNTEKQLKYHYFAVEQQPHLLLPENASQVSRTALLSYVVEIYGAQKAQFFSYVIHSQTYISR